LNLAAQSVSIPPTPSTRPVTRHENRHRHHAITHGQIIDGTGRPPLPNAALVLRDGRIAYAGLATDAPVLPPDTERIDAPGGTIMPGLVEAHFHATYFNIAALEDLDINYPVEYVSLLSSVNTHASGDKRVGVHDGAGRLSEGCWAVY
jgi:imidazolonepropionase-like amidohydrolase